jgi:hypothetical protein
LDDPLVAVFEGLGGTEVVVVSVDCVACGESVPIVKVRVPCGTAVVE